MYKPGELVVRRWSKAKIFKRKVLKVIGEVPDTGYVRKYRVVDPWGKQVELYEHSLQNLNDEERKLKRAKEIAERDVTRAVEQYVRFKNDMRDAAMFFPRVT